MNVAPFVNSWAIDDVISIQIPNRTRTVPRYCKQIVYAGYHILASDSVRTCDDGCTVVKIHAYECL